MLVLNLGLRWVVNCLLFSCVDVLFSLLLLVSLLPDLDAGFCFWSSCGFGREGLLLDSGFCIWFFVFAFGCVWLFIVVWLRVCCSCLCLACWSVWAFGSLVVLIAVCLLGGCSLVLLVLGLVLWDDWDCCSEGGGCWFICSLGFGVLDLFAL